jgi:sugar phosphate isomerase/epimerase
MVLSIHQNTSRAAGYRRSLEGWAKAGIQYVELTDTILDDFLKTESLAAAKAVLTDNGLTPVSSAAVLPDLWIPGPAHLTSMDTWKRRCEQFSTIGLQKIYCPSVTNRRVSADDFKATPDCIREAGEIARQFNLTAMIEFARTSTHISTLATSLRLIREANHPNVRPMLDFFHFWSGMSKFEDLDMIRPGEIAHVHFQDILDTPRELIDNNGRVIPGDGSAPVVRILQKLKEKQYSGALSVELFLAHLTNGDPQAVGAEIRTKCENVMRQAGVL